MPVLSQEQAMAKAARFCSMRERSTQEVRLKLASWGAQHIEQIIERLQQEKFVDDERFVTAFCNDKFKFNGWGKLKIRAAMSQHHLPQSTIEAGLSYIDTHAYYEKAKSLALRKKESLKEDDPAKAKAKVIRYLASRGFEMDVIRIALE